MLNSQCSKQAERFEDQCYFITCSCGSEAIHLHLDFEFEVLDMSWWVRGHNRPHNLWWRLRQILRIIKRGYPYSDDICLNIKQVKELKVRLDEFLKKIDLQTQNQTGSSNL